MTAETLRDIVKGSAERFQNQPAYRYKVKKEIVEKSYIQVNEDSMAISRAIENTGKKGEHIALLGMTSYPWIVSFFGIVNSGSVAVPINAQLPAEMIVEELERADVSMLLFDEVRMDVAALLAEKHPEIELVSFQGQQTEGGIKDWQTILEENRGEYETVLSGDMLCTILFTSGTTGKSKGVMLSHRNLTDNAVCLDMKIPAGTVSLTLLPINHVYCLTMDIIKGLYIGITSCINDSIMHVQKNLKLFQPDIMLVVPMILESIYGKLKAVDASIPKSVVAKEVFGENLKTICSGGAYLNPDYVEKFNEYGIQILQGYGMTECSPVISTNLPWHVKAGSVGKLMPNCKAKIVDDEIWVRGSSVMMGYYKMPEETKETLEDGWLKTGDLGYVDEENYVYITGRKKNLIILANGENVSPEEIENQLACEDLVKEVLVREKENVIEAEIFPDYEYAETAKVENVEEKLQKIVDEYNNNTPVYKRVHHLLVRETEFEKTASKKIKRF